MLIPSPRHTAADLELWAELEEADRIHGERFLRSSRLQESRRAIREFAAAGPCYGGVSWGKESLALAHLLWSEAPSVPLVHLRPTNHNPDCDAVRDAYFAAFSGQPYEEVAVDYGTLHGQNLPDHLLDRETDAIWYAAIRECEARSGGRHLLGIRNGESFGRMIRTLRWGLNTPRASAPIARWTLAEVYGYLAAHDLPVHPAYAMLGGGRWPRERLRVAEIGDTHGKGSGRGLWEAEYYGDVLRRLEAGRSEPARRDLGCACLYCRGDSGRRLVLVPFEIAEAANLVALARKGRVTIKPTDQVFVVEGLRAVGCVRVIRRHLARLCGCWVDPSLRGKGIGEMLVRHRIAFIENHMSASAIDTFAFRKALFLRLGFEEKQGYKIGTTVLRKVVARGRGE